VTASDLEPLAPLRDRLAEAAVLCDVDGTLAPIVARPEDARLLEGVADALRALRPRVALLGFVSGRALADAARIVGLEDAAYAGNHGMELRLPGHAARTAPEVAPHLEAIARLAEAWPPERLAGVGVRLEEKGPTLSFHRRGAPDPAAADALLARVAENARVAGLVTTTGREVLEVRPPVAIDKGTAVRALLAGSGARLATYLGDDRTDADAWRALRELVAEGVLEHAVGVAAASGEVPPEVHAAADVEVDGPAGALAVLRFLAA
jgi:trehalose 6-phosphate phosphatase